MRLSFPARRSASTTVRPSTTNWNNFTGNGTKAAGTVVHLDGTVSDLLAMTVSNGQFFNNDGTNNWVGLQSNPTSIAPNPKAPAEFVESVTTDIAGNFSLGDATPFRLVVTGLNPFLDLQGRRGFQRGRVQPYGVDDDRRRRHLRPELRSRAP